MKGTLINYFLIYKGDVEMQIEGLKKYVGKDVRYETKVKGVRKVNVLRITGKCLDIQDLDSYNAHTIRADEFLSIQEI
ncbi:hypothetical protein [Virgibacillus sp. DJP39]|uniref:hypothetical protein n=1 Tax=Virgibacillus sp. DJP39 TaxID=3409790 RepID=UPI003BB5289B